MIKKNGISLIEVVVYIAIFGLVLVFVVNSLILIVNTYNRARAERETLSNARLLLETVNKAVSQAQEVYGPTSRFNDDNGQLSLVTTLGSTAEHSTIYIDYWVDGGRFWARQEGGGPQAISASSVRINKFRLERIIQGLGREAVKITLQADYAIPKFSTIIILNSTTALRGNY